MEAAVDLPAPPSDGTAMTIFVLGLLGLVVCGIIAPVAWFMGQTYRRQCLELGVPQHQFATIGRILGMVGSVLFLLQTVLLVAFGVLYAVFLGILLS